MAEHPQPPIRRNPPLLRVSAGLLSVLCLGDLAMPFLLGPFYPGYSQWTDTLSTLATPRSPVRGLASGWLVLFGAAWVAALWPIRPGKGTACRDRSIWFGLLAWGVGGGILAGLFAEDLPGQPESLSGKLHGISAGIGSLGLLIAVTVAPAQLPAQRLTLALLAVLAWIGFTLFLGAKHPAGLAGLWQKAWLAAAYASVCLLLWSRRDRGPAS